MNAQCPVIVSVRHFVPHRKTLMYLEQKILSANASEGALQIQRVPLGLNFYFPNKSRGKTFTSFLRQLNPLRSSESTRVLGVTKYRKVPGTGYNIKLELAPVCKNDVFLLSPDVSEAHGGIGPLIVVTHVSRSITVVDIATMQTVDISTEQFWRSPFSSPMRLKQLVTYTVEDIMIPPNQGNGRYLIADVNVARMFGTRKSQETYRLRTHLGRNLRVGNFVYGVDVKDASKLDNTIYSYQDLQELPEVVLVKKTYKKRDYSKKRPWLLLKLNVILGDLKDMKYPRSWYGCSPRTKSRVSKSVVAKFLKMQVRIDSERFLQDIERDEDLRAGIELFKDRSFVPDASVSDPGSKVTYASARRESDFNQHPEVPENELNIIPVFEEPKWPGPIEWPSW